MYLHDKFITNCSYGVTVFPKYIAHKLVGNGSISKRDFDGHRENSESKVIPEGEIIECIFETDRLIEEDDYDNININIQLLYYEKYDIYFLTQIHYSVKHGSVKLDLKNRRLNTIDKILDI